MQRACAIFLPVACPALQYLSTLSHKRHDFGGKVTEHKLCFVFCTTFVLNISHSKKKWARYKRTSVFMCTTRFSCRVLMKLEFSTRFSKSTLKLIEFRPVGAELLHAGRRTDREAWWSCKSLFEILRTLSDRWPWHGMMRLGESSLKNERYAPECNVILIVCSIKWWIRYSAVQRLGNCVGWNSPKWLQQSSCRLPTKFHPLTGSSIWRWPFQYTGPQYAKHYPLTTLTNSLQAGSMFVKLFRPWTELANLFFFF